jgi:hypothetical protein
MSVRDSMARLRLEAALFEQGGETTMASVCDEAAELIDAALPEDVTRNALQTLMASHGHTLTVEQRAAVRGWLGRVA